MPVPVTCPGCSAKMNAPDAAAGKKVKCLKCQQIITVPAPAVADFEVVEDEPAPKKPTVSAPAKPKSKAVVEIDDEEDEDDRPRKKKPAKAVVEDDDDRPRKKKPAKAIVEDDEDDDEDDRPRKKRRAAVEDDEDDDDDRPRKKKKKRAGESGTSLVRNIVGGVVLLILLGVAGYVYYDKFGRKEKDEPTSSSSSSDPPTSAPTGRPNPKLPTGGPGPKLPAGPNNPVPKQSGQPNLYTGDGISGGQMVEVEVFVYAPYYGVYTSDEWAFALSDEEGGVPSYWAYLRPDQQAKINDLWVGQSIKIRAQKLPKAPTEPVTKLAAAEIVSTGAPPEFVEMTVDQLLKEFQDGPEAAKKKWKKTASYNPPWIKLTGTFDGASPAEIELPGIQLKGTGGDTNTPNRVYIDVPSPIKPLVRRLKRGQQLTVRVRGLDDMAAGQVRFTTGLFPFSK